LRMLQNFAVLLSPGAKVVNISTRLASLTNTDGVNDPLYSASKAALNMLTRQLAFDDVFANSCMIAASPGWVRTRMGGPGAMRSPEEGAKTPARLALLPDDGPTGGFFRDEQPIVW
jgi:NAD(P)-dependent dehydrogenase (short-subunit alcohol dehydrogenase family)